MILAVLQTVITAGAMAAPPAAAPLPPPGGAVSVTDEALSRAADALQRREGIDAAPEGGAALAAAVELLGRGTIRASDRIVLFNTGAGWLYRS